MKFKNKLYKERLVKISAKSKMFNENNKVKIIGIVNYITERATKGNTNTFLTIKTKNSADFDVYAKCVRFKSSNLGYKKGDKVEVVGEINSFFDKEKNTGFQNIAILKMRKVI
jgi:SUMO ligase MMS21 Smc5/6 complex component